MLNALVPVDGSDDALAAVRHAILLPGSITHETIHRIDAAIPVTLVKRAADPAGGDPS